MPIRSLLGRCELRNVGVADDDNATTLLQEGGDLSAVSKLMGHSSVHMTANQYYHLLGDEKRRTIAKLPSLNA